MHGFWILGSKFCMLRGVSSGFMHIVHHKKSKLRLGLTILLSASSDIPSTISFE